MKASELIARLAAQVAGEDDPEAMMSIRTDDGECIVLEIVDVKSTGGWHVWLRNFKQAD